MNCPDTLNLPYYWGDWWCFLTSSTCCSYHPIPHSTTGLKYFPTCWIAFIGRSLGLKVLHNNSNNPENVHEKAVHNFPNFILEYPKLIIRGIFQKALLMVLATNNTSINTLQGIFKNFLNFSDLLLLTFFFFSKI